ncbi:MAG TPA: hypothetical protein VGH98_00480 [Gemmatimonadaceae bacterium]|jgi:hypothetical protein
MSAEVPRSVRVFVNAVGVDVPPGASVLDAIRSWSADEAAAVTRGERVVTDSRGLPIAADVRVSAGSIFRLIPARKRDGDEVTGGSDA